MRAKGRQVVHTYRDALADAEGYALAANHLHNDPAERMQTLRAIVRAIAALDRALPGAVAGARASGMTWELIAGTMGITRQGAWARFAPPGTPKPVRGIPS